MLLFRQQDSFVSGRAVLLPLLAASAAAAAWRISHMGRQKVNGSGAAGRRTTAATGV